jgi:hypothetical protein
MDALNPLNASTIARAPPARADVPSQQDEGLDGGTPRLPSASGGTHIARWRSVNSRGWGSSEEQMTWVRYSAFMDCSV